MKRLLQYTGLTLLGLAVVTAVTAWLLIATEVGSRWLLSRLLMQTPVAVQIDAIAGRLSDRLVLRQVESNWQGGSILIEELALTWSPWSLPWRHVKIDRLATKSLILSLDASQESPTGQPLRLAWPNMPQWLQGWRVNLAALSMEDTQLVNPGGEDLVAEQVDASIRLDKGQLFLDNVVMLGHGQRLSANLEFNLMTPGVAAKLQLDSQDIVNEVAIDLNLDQGTDKRILAGPLTGRIILKDHPKYRFNGTVQVEENRLSISRLMVSRAGLEGNIEGDLELNLAEALTIASDLAISRWALPLEQDSLLVLDGRLAGTGNPEAFQGQFDLTASGPRWLSGHLAGDWTGSRESLQVLVQNGDWLGSSISGSLTTTLNQDPTVKANMAIKDLDPAQFSADWNGSLNLDTDLEITGIGKGLRVQFETAFLSSQLRNVPLQGAASGLWHKGNLELDALNLDGDGFKIDAAGSLADRLDLSFDITDLGGIIPQSAGKLYGSGWLGLREQDWIASLSATVDSLNYDKVSLNTANLTLDRPTTGAPARLHIKADEAGYDTSQLDSIELMLDGDFARHTATLSAGFDGGNIHAEVTGHHEAGLWRGNLIDLSISHDQFGLWQLSAPLVAQYNESYFELGPMQLNGSNGDLSLSGRFRHNGLPDQMHMTVSRLPLSLFNNLVSPWQLSGTLDMDISCSEKSCHLLASGLESIGEADSTLIFKDMQFDGLWDDSGLQAGIDLELSEGHIIGRLSSASPRDALSIFPLGWSLSCERIPLEKMFIIPRKYTLSGTLGGQAQGILNENLTFSGQGQFETVKALFSWQDGDSGRIDFTVNEAATTLNWHKDALQGTLTLVMEEHGQLSAAWQLPIPARWPVVPTKQGQLNGHLGGWLTENGLAGILWPELIQETQGDLEIDTLFEGTWDKPLINGLVHLKNGGGYLPGTGVKLDGIELAARLDGQQILFDKLTASSDPAGTLTGGGTIRLQGWKPDHLDVSIRGEDFALMHLPELQVKINPDLNLSGTRDNLLLTGSIHIPSLLVTGREQRSPVQVSPDVIVVDRESDEVREMPFRLATRVNLTLGDKILVKMFGLDARLGGQVELTGIDPQHFSGTGQITIEEGSFATYGVKLDIDKGRASYGGGPLDNPALDILALKKAVDAKVGVQIRGTAKQPEVKLYSEPAMADTEILSLIVLGRPLNQAGGETDPLMLAAGALLSAGDSAVLRNRLQSQLGIDTLEAESDTGETTDTILRLGKYLTPDLYLSYGYALFGQRSEVGLRYHIYKGWEAESKFGIESGADIYYRFEFD